MMTKPRIHYYAVRGRAEVARLALSLAHVDWYEVEVGDNFVATLDEYPFEEVPRYVDGDMDLVQTGTILRFIAKKYKLFGTNDKQEFAADMILEGVESLRQKYAGLVFQAKLEQQAVQEYYAMHVCKDSMGRTKGAHFRYLHHFLERNGSGFMVGHKPTIADLAVWDIFDLHMRIFGDRITAEYPDLAKHHQTIATLPGIKEYLASPTRHVEANHNHLG